METEMTQKTCRRGHKMVGKNARKQINSHRKADGKIHKYVTRICVACLEYRTKRREKGLPVKDMRKGRR